MKVLDTGGSGGDDGLSDNSPHLDELVCSCTYYKVWCGVDMAYYIYYMLYHWYLYYIYYIYIYIYVYAYM